MKVTADKNEQVAKMTFASVYPLYMTKVEKQCCQLKTINHFKCG